MLVPKLVTTLRTYTRQQFAADVVAGVIVGVVALPLAIAFAIASGVTPDRGLYTAVIAGFLISALGGSRVQIGGPTGAFVVIVYGIVQRYGVDGLLAATLMAGVILLILGFARLGGAIKFIPFPVVTGFTAAIGALIAIQQLRDALGLQMAAPPAELVERLVAYANARRDGQPLRGRPHGLHPAHCSRFWPRLSHRVPAPLVALLAGHGRRPSCWTCRWRPSGAVSARSRSSLPRPVLPSVSLAELRELVGPAFAIAALGAIESLLSAVVADGMIGGRHRSNMELVAQGVANIASPLFGGMPATGAIARTATNIKSGGRTPVAGIVHALTLLLITLFFGRWAALIPLAVLAAHRARWWRIRLSEWRVFVQRAARAAERRAGDGHHLPAHAAGGPDRGDRRGHGAGRVPVHEADGRGHQHHHRARASSRSPARRSGDDRGAIYRRQIPPGVEVYEINGPFFFGAAEKFKQTLGEVSRRPQGAGDPDAQRAGHRLDRHARAQGPGPPHPRRGHRRCC